MALEARAVMARSSPTARVAVKGPTRKSNEEAAIRRLVDELGATVMLDRQERLPVLAIDRLKRRVAAEELIEQSYADALEPSPLAGHSPVLPIWSPYKLPVEGRIAIVGPCPSVEAIKHGELGHSRAEKLLLQTLRHFGIPHSRVTQLTVVQHPCVTGEVPEDARPGWIRGLSNRAPTTAETLACRLNLMDALDAADVDYVLLHGLHAVHAWRADVKMQQVAGAGGLWSKRWWVWSINHASSVMRQDGYDGQLWQRQVGAFVDAVLEGQTWETFGNTCTNCATPTSYAYDQDGLPWCREHVHESQAGHRNTSKRNLKNTTRQGTLEL